MKRVLITIALLFNVSFLQAAAKNDVSRETEKLIKNSVMGYAHGIMKAAKTGNPDTLHHLLAPELYETTVVWIQSWHFATVYMDSRLDTIDFKKIERVENRATAETDEKWFYTYYYTESKKVLYPEKEINYKIRYNLAYKNEKWMIKDIEIVGEKSKVDDPDILIYPKEEANKRPYSIQNKGQK